MHDDSSSLLVTLNPGDDGVAVSAELYGEASDEVDEQSVRGEVITFSGDATGDAGSEVRAESARRNAAELMRRSTPGLSGRRGDFGVSSVVRSGESDVRGSALSRCDRGRRGESASAGRMAEGTRTLCCGDPSDCSRCSFIMSQRRCCVITSARQLQSAGEPNAPRANPPKLPSAPPV